MMNMVIYSIDKAKKFRLNREVRPTACILSWHLLLLFSHGGSQRAMISAILSLLVDLKVLNGNSFIKVPKWDLVLFD